jgi:hypothetical protein
MGRRIAESFQVNPVRCHTIVNSFVGFRMSRTFTMKRS